MLTVKEAADLLGIAARTMYSLAAPAGPLPCYRIRRMLRFELADVLAYREQCKRVPAWPAQVAPLRSLTIRAASIDESDLRKAFRKLGIEPRDKRSR